MDAKQVFTIDRIWHVGLSDGGMIPTGYSSDFTSRWEVVNLLTALGNEGLQQHHVNCRMSEKDMSNLLQQEANKDWQGHVCNRS